MRPILLATGSAYAQVFLGRINKCFDTESLDAPSRDFLEGAIADYNAMFSTSFDTSSQGFQNYYKDLSERMKTRQVDLTIVVNMFLTGFDATTLNTLWVDKDLREHGLIQAFSRTNRILNAVKTYGNIVCFRNLEDRVNRAISRFGDKEAGGHHQRRPGLRGRIAQAGRYQHRLHPHAGAEVPRFPLRRQDDRRDIERAIGASYELRNKRDLIEAFIEGLESGDDVSADWERYIAAAKERELSAIIEEEALDEAATRAFMADALAEGGVSESGTRIAGLMTKKPSRFAPANAYAAMKARVIQRLKGFFDRFDGLGR